MQTEEDEAPVVLKKKSDKNQQLNENESAACDGEDPKPRIVLTFRSDKSGARNSNMKIVPNDDKHDEVSPRRSSRTRGKCYWSDDNEASVSPKKEKTSQPVSENDGETSDSSHTPKRFTRRRSKDSSENVLANAIARKEKSFNEASLTQRLSRRIKPTAKILANEELRIGMESQNNARLGITAEKEEGVRTRRSARPMPVETEVNQPSTSTKKSNKVDQIVIEDESSQENTEDHESAMKLKHLCELGLKAINTDSMDEDTEDMEIDDEEDQDEDDEEDEEVNEEDLEGDEEDEVDDDSEVISKLLEADEDSSEDFSCSVDSAKKKRPRRSTRLSTYGGQDTEANSPIPDEEDPKDAPRRSSRRSTGFNTYESDREYCPPRKRNRSSRRNEPQLEMEQEEENCRSRRHKNRSAKEEDVQSEGDHEDHNNSEATGAEEGVEAACPEDDDSAIVATCFCEDTSNVYAAPDDLTSPVFCQAIESIDGMRVGCSHTAARDSEGGLLPLLRAGPRAPFLLLCRLHRAMLRRHMGCPACGLYCAQGSFSRCSEGHLFHAECASAVGGGCPHCGVRARRWLPANCRTSRVTLRLCAASKRTYLPEQREHCTPAYLGFSNLPTTKLDQEPLIPEELLPSISVDLKALYLEKDEDMADITTSALELYEAILAKETVEQLIPRIKSRAVLAEQLAKYGGGSCVHAACEAGHLPALHLARCAGASLEQADGAARTPLLAAVRVILEKSEDKTELDSVKSPIHDVSEVADSKVDDDNEMADVKQEIKESPKVEVEDGETDKASREDLLKVIRYLIAAGCDVDAQGPEGLTALHMAARDGDAELCALLLDLGNAAVDSRDHGGWTPLAWAAEHAHPHVLRLLINHGADAGSRDLEGNGAIHWCALAGEQRALLMLLESAPHAIDLPNAHGDTPLHVSARQGHYACVVILLARGASTDLKNSAGELPVDVCTGGCQNAILLNVQLAQISGGQRKKKILSNDISNGRELYPVACENEVDDTPLPDDFVYVTEYVMPAPVPVDDTLPTMKGCLCKDGECSSGECACCVLSVRAWAVRGRLPPAFPYHDPPMLFECNQTCACNANKCGNQSVTRMLRAGSLGARVAVFRTRGARGWGLRAARAVRRGQPLAAYCGELLPLPAADARRHDEYVFSLDVKPDLLEQCSERTALCVDARGWGSAARFANHSCAPNAAPVRVFCGARDLRRPHAVLYAVKHIRAGEEITFDYGDKFWSVKSKWMKCECGTPDCRYGEKSESDT